MLARVNLAITANGTSANVAAGIERDVHNGNRNQRIEQTWPERSHKSDRQQHVGKCHQDIDQPHEDIVNDVPVEASDKTDGSAENKGHARCNGSNHYRYSGSPDESTEQVAA